MADLLRRKFPNDEEVAECHEARTGKSIWKASYPTAYRDSFGYDDGPRGTPTIVNGRVYLFGAKGTLSCVDFDKGKILWQRKTHDDYEPKDSYFGAACSPLVLGSSVFVNVGGMKKAPQASGPPRGTSIVAFDAETGKTLWTTLDDEASYSSPVVAKFGNEELLVFHTRTYAAVVDPKNGDVRFKKRWRARIAASVNAATPIVDGETVFFSSSYSTGALFLRHTGKGLLEQVWTNDSSLSLHFATPVLKSGYLYGFHGRQEASTPLRCVELKSGAVRWEQKTPGKSRYGSGSLIVAGDIIVALTDNGELTLLSADPTSFQRLATASIIGDGIRAHASLADGLLFARNKTELVCVDLAKP